MITRIETPSQFELPVPQKVSEISRYLYRLSQDLDLILSDMEDTATKSEDALRAAFGKSLAECVKADSMADRVVEQGEKGIWDYRKWLSGVAECWCNVAFTGLACNKAVGSLYQSDNITFESKPYPFKFTAPPDVTYAYVTTNGSVAWLMAAYDANIPNKLTEYPPHLRLLRATSGTNINGYISFQVKGFWK